MTVIEIENLRKVYKDATAVDGLCLTVEQGELFSLLGVNGAGKSTTIKILCCLTSPTEGEAYLHGHSVRKEAFLVKSLIGVSPQETAIAPNLTVEENLRLLCGVHGMKKEEGEKRTREISARLKLEGQLKRRAGKLSGGWQRRLSIAMALVSQPKILFLDEPTLGLDVLARGELWSLIEELKGEMTILLTTHYMEEAEALSDRVGVMHEGKLIAVDSVDGLKERTGRDTLEKAFVALVRGEQV